MHYKPRSLADAVDKVARKSAGKDWGLYANLLGHWAEIVGQEYARVTTPVKITFPYQPQEAQRKNGVLLVRLPKGLAMEFSFKADLIRQRVNIFIGYEAFTRIALEPSSVAPASAKVPKKIDEKIKAEFRGCLDSVENSELREALENFGLAMLSRAD